MSETTKTSEALSSALGGDGLMQSEYYKLVFNDETGQWEKQKVTEDIEPVFPGIRDVTPEYTPEGKTFKTIPIGAGPDYSPVVPDVPTLPITQPVDPVVPEEPEVSQPVVTQPDQGPRPDPMDIPTFVNKEKTTVTVGDNVFPSTVIKNLPSYRDKYQSLPGGFNNWSDSQVLQYAIDTGALNSMLSQNNNPYYIAEPEKQTGIMADIKATLPLPLQIGAKALDATLGVRERKALVKRMIDAGMLFGEANNYLDEKGNFKSNDVGRLLKTFKDDNAPQNGLVSPDTNVYEMVPERAPFNVAKDVDVPFQRTLDIREFYDTSIEDTEEDIKFKLGIINSDINAIDEQNKLFDETGFYTGVTGKNREKKFGPGPDIANVRFLDLQERDKLLAQKEDLENKIKTGNFGETIFDPRDRKFKSITPGLEEELKKFQQSVLDRLEAGQGMASVGIKGLSDNINPLLSTAPQPSFIDTLQQFSIQDNKIVPGISQSQPVMGTSGSHVNGEAVYVNSEAGHYTSDGKYHFDSNGDGITDAVAAGGSAGNAQEAANSGFLPQAVLDRMTNPDGSLKNLYTPQGGPTGNYGLNSDVIELRDGKYYYVGNVVKENRDVVDKDNNTIDNAAPDDSKDNQNYVNTTETEQNYEDTYGTVDDVQGFGTGDGSSKDKSKDDTKKIVCTEMYRQTHLDDWKMAMKIWGFHTKTHLTKYHQKGYHFIFMPWVKGMRKNNILTLLGGWLAQRRTQHLKYILSRDIPNKSKMLGVKDNEKDDVIGRIWCSFWHPITFTVGKILTILNIKDF